MYVQELQYNIIGMCVRPGTGQAQQEEVAAGALVGDTVSADALASGQSQHAGSLAVEHVIFLFSVLVVTVTFRGSAAAALVLRLPSSSLLLDGIP